jgi:hypothetical protein
MRDDVVSAFRAELLTRIPRWYSPVGHLLGTTGVGVAATAIAIARIHGLTWPQLLAVPITVVAANFFEWWAHKNVLHRRRRLFGYLYEQHTPMHHRLYREEDMAVRDRRELKFVLMPAMGVLGIVLSASPIAIAVGLLVSPNAGWLTLMTQALYVVSYELTHLSYHLPPDHWVRRIGFIRRLAAHHARHHDPRRMQRWNFNVTLPLADWVLGTSAPHDDR